MKRLGWLAVVCAVIALSLVACAAAGPVVEKAGEVMKAAAPLLPPPFGWIVSLLGAGAVAVGGHFAGKSRAEALKAGLAGADLSPIVKLFAERKFLLPILMAGVTAAKASGLLPITGEELTQILVAFGIPTAGEFVKDSMAAKAAPAKP